MATILERPTVATPVWPLPMRRRVVLTSASAVAVGLAAFLGDPAVMLAWDAELATLLRGMALIKALMAFAVLAALWWRFASPLSAAAFRLSTLCAALISGSAMMVWQLDFIIATGIAFHTALITLAVLALRDGHVSTISKARRRQTRPPTA